MKSHPSQSLPNLRVHKPDLASESLPDLRSLPPDTLLSPEQAADALGLKPSTLSIWRSVGRYNLPYIKAGRMVRYRVGDVLAWLDRRARTHTGEPGAAA